MKNEKLVSVIVPIYNSELYLEQCIQSLVDQTYTNIEVVLIDDGSTDKSAYIVECYAKHDDRIKYFFQENQGVSKARNYGVQMAQGDYLYFVDSDDWIDSNALSLLMENVLENNIEFAFSNYYYVYDNETKMSHVNSDTQIIKREKMIENYLLLKNRGLIGGCLFKRQKWNLLGLEFPKQKQCEEWFLIVQFVCNTDNIFYSSEPLYYYRQRQDSAIHIVNYGLINSCYQTSKNIIDYVNDNVDPLLIQAFSALTVSEMFHIINDLGKEKLSEEQQEKFKLIIKERVSITSNKYLLNPYLDLKQKLSFCLCKYNLYFLVKKYIH